MKLVHHLVMLRFKPGAESCVPRLFDALAALQRLPGMLSFRAGAYSSPEGLNKGFSHAFVMTFQDFAARDHYLAHPDHERVKEDFLPAVEDILTFDFEG